MTIHIDFETRSAAKLKDVGQIEYARHASTDILCMAYAVNDQEPEIWFPGKPVPSIDWKGPIWAHNAGFEQAIWWEIATKRYDFPQVTLDQWHCSMAVAATYGLPQSLDGLAAYLGVDQRKDAEGHKLMMKLSTIKKTKQKTLFDHAEQLDRLGEYCKQDVRVEVAVTKKLGGLTPEERQVWLLDQKINWRGLQIDRDLCRQAIELSGSAIELRSQRLAELTDDVVTAPTQTTRIVEWLHGKGITLGSIAAGVLDEALKEDLPEDVREVLLIRAASAKSSIAKFAQMLQRSESDGRMRNNLRYHGGFTGRWAGLGAQIQNYPRGSINQTDTLAETIVDGDAEEVRLFFGDELEACKSVLRSAIIAPKNKRLLIWDYGQIEARVLAWLAGESKLLQLFATGSDVYRSFASTLFSKPADRISKDERFIGKTCVLGLGYGMGSTKLQGTLAGYGTEISDAFARRCVNVYRETYPQITRLWRCIETAAVNAMIRGKCSTHKTLYVSTENLLFCELASGREIVYLQPQLEQAKGKQSLKYKSVKNSGIVTDRTYGGKLVENIVQALARDVLINGMLAIENAKLPIVATIHDEIIAECFESDADQRLAEGERLLTQTPDWADGLPLAVEGFHSKRYRK